MHYDFLLLLATGFLIVIASFSLVFSFDRSRSPKVRQTLLAVSVCTFMIIACLVTILMTNPLG
ncbi:hypothetical protein KIM322_04510 [Lactobacillus xylocopicola]|uniref:Uncharacterized protein n=1 Tax=Lactobacillus xylocopicola TaxID=2976676 RepID=A0ABM8BG09_9LACO|nr:hypothetical protein KIM322_04510 [Lactobacillus xylocopicola]